MRADLLCMLVLVTSPGFVISKRILAVLPAPVRSHFIFSHSILAELAQRGHEVVVYSPFKPTEAVSNITYIQVETVFDTYIKEKMTFESLIKIVKMNYLGMVLALWGYYSKSQFFLETPQLQILLKSDDKFDLVVTEGTRGQESMLVFGAKFQAPNVVLWTTGPAPTLNTLVGNSISLSHIPDYFSYAFTDQMTFMERTKNVLSAMFILAYYNYVHLPLHERLLSRLAPEVSHPPLTQLATDVSLTLVNAHPTLGLPQPYTPNMVAVGGAHIAPKNNSLPEDLANFMEHAPNGVIYFSLGSIVPDHLLPLDLIMKFINVFKRLSQKVLWKISANNLPDLPTNIMVSKWVPQQAILNHPACVLFITHGGLHGQFEVLEAGVPVVGIPVASDQQYNVRQFERLGVGIGLPITSLTEQNLEAAIHRVLTNPSYRENAKRVSEMFQSVPVPPLQKAVYWVEYVLRHGGASHLRPQAATMPLYKQALLDVLAVAFIIALAVSFICYHCLKRVFCGRSNYNLRNKKDN